MNLDGAPRPLVEDVSDADWGPDGEMAIVRRVGGMHRLEYPIDTVLYETSGYVSDIRISPDGTQVAFLDHQWVRDDRGRLKTVDAARQVTTLSEEFWAIEGVVWASDGQDILFSGTIHDVNLVVLAVNLASSQVREVLSSPVGITVLDLDPQGNMLVIDETTINGVMAHPPGATQDIDLTWLDSCWGPGLTPDNQTLVFTNGYGGTNYSVVTRTLDLSPLTTLGEGDARDLSPDGAWVLAKVADPPGLVLYPLGTGAPLPLERGPIVQYFDCQWLPDSRHIIFTAKEADGPLRCYRQAVVGGPPERLDVQAAESYSLLTLDGKALLGLGSDFKWSLLPLAGGDPVPVRGLKADDDITAWNPEGTAVYVMEQNLVPTTFIRVDMTTGEREEAFTLGPDRTPGLLWLRFTGPVLDPSQGYAYAFQKTLNQIHVVQGARWKQEVGF